MQAKIESVMGAAPDSSSASATRAEEGKVNSWSIYVGNMDYAYTSGKVQQYLQPNGTKNRVTILTDEFRSTNKIRWMEIVGNDGVWNDTAYFSWLLNLMACINEQNRLKRRTQRSFQDSLQVSKKDHSVIGSHVRLSEIPSLGWVGLWSVWYVYIG